MAFRIALIFSADTLFEGSKSLVAKRHVRFEMKLECICNKLIGYVCKGILPSFGINRLSRVDKYRKKAHYESHLF